MKSRKRISQVKRRAEVTRTIGKRSALSKRKRLVNEVRGRGRNDRGDGEGG